MRDAVSFRYPAPFVPLSEQDGVLASGGAGWFCDLLKRVPALTVSDELCQEDWGVVIFAQRNDWRYWIGLCLECDGEEGSWLAHIHHASFAWLQRLRPRGREALQGLIADIHAVLTSTPAVTEIRWFSEVNLSNRNAAGAPSPSEPVG